MHDNFFFSIFLMGRSYCTLKVNTLTVGRLDDKAERAVLTEEYSQLDFLK